MRLVMMLAFSLISCMSYAQQCLEAVPASASFIEKPANNKLTRSQEASLNRLFKELARSWTGKSSGYYCIGEEIQKARKEYKSHQLEMSFTNDTPLVLRARTQAQDNDEFTQKLSSLTVYADQGYLRFDQNNSAGDVWVEQLSSTHLSVWSISRAGTVYHLINRVIKRSAGAFSISITTYSNNRLTSHYEGRLRY